jgi:predicted AAA+ superfamily ATPase
MPLQMLCQPRPSVFDAVRRATVLDLADFLNKRINGKEFFEENYFTYGMSTLVEGVFKQLAGVSGGSPVFLLSQAMGGGKTHCMIGLGLLAQDPTLRKNVLGDKDPAPNLGRCRVIGFSGRSNVDASGGIWGSLAEQLGKAELFKPHISPMLLAPGLEAWKTLLTGDPLIIFLDELPPYFEYAVAIPAGDGNLGTITKVALASLVGAVSNLPNVCLILSDLANTNYTVGQQSLQAAFDRAIDGCQNEALGNIPTALRPVNPDELYHILRKRLFERVASESDIQEVASAYRAALEKAVKMNLTTTSPQALYYRIADSYPFHPDWRELLGRFKENQGFQQTRGIIRLMQMVVESLYFPDKKNDGKVRAAEIDLIHPYEINLNNDEIASEIRNINSSLSEAIARDIAHDGDAEAEQIDESNGNADASEAARVILVASLATNPNSIHGLREYQLVDCLQRPGRDLSTFKFNVLDKLALRAGYMHTSVDGRLYFKNQQNLASKLRTSALSLDAEVVDRML